MNISKRMKRFVAIGLLAFVATACAETKADTVGLKYGAGPIEGEVTPSDAVKASFDANVASRQGVIDARNRADALVAEAEGKREAQAALEGLYTDPGWIEYLNAQAVAACASNSNCTLIVSNLDDTGVNVNTGKTGE